MMWILLSFLGIHLLFPLRNMKCYFIGILCISVSLPHMVTKQKHMRGNTDALIPKWKGKQKKKSSNNISIIAPLVFFLLCCLPLLPSPRHPYGALPSCHSSTEGKTSAAWQSSLPRAGCGEPPTLQDDAGQLSETSKQCSSPVPPQQSPQSPAPAATQPWPSPAACDQAASPGRAGATEPTSRCELAVDLRVHFLVAHVTSDLLRGLSDDGNSKHKSLKRARGGREWMKRPGKNTSASNKSDA